jgi:hypothetical protein
MADTPLRTTTTRYSKEGMAALNLNDKWQARLAALSTRYAPIDSKLKAATPASAAAAAAFSSSGGKAALPPSAASTSSSAVVANGTAAHADDDAAELQSSTAASDAKGKDSKAKPTANTKRPRSKAAKNQEADAELRQQHVDEANKLNEAFQAKCDAEFKKDPNWLASCWNVKLGLPQSVSIDITPFLSGVMKKTLGIATTDVNKLSYSFQYYVPVEPNGTADPYVTFHEVLQITHLPLSQEEYTGELFASVMKSRQILQVSDEKSEPLYVWGTKLSEFIGLFDRHSLMGKSVNFQTKIRGEEVHIFTAQGVKAFAAILRSYSDKHYDSASGGGGAAAETDEVDVAAQAAVEATKAKAAAATPTRKPKTVEAKVQADPPTNKKKKKKADETESEDEQPLTKKVKTKAVASPPASAAPAPAAPVETVDLTVGTQSDEIELDSVPAPVAVATTVPNVAAPPTPAADNDEVDFAAAL